MYCEEGFGAADDSSFNLKMNSTEMGRKVDTKHEKYTIQFNNTWKDGKYRKTVTIENYGSGQQGSRIRNAVTGEKYSHSELVGSKFEDLYFKVIESTGRFNRRDPLILFYDTPDQYENHHFTTVNTLIKEKWYEKCLATRNRLQID
jgi:hypothetical protein